MDHDLAPTPGRSTDLIDVPTLTRLDTVRGSADHRLVRASERREGFRLRQTAGLSQLLVTRTDLRGVHALADLVDDSVRWSA